MDFSDIVSRANDFVNEIFASEGFRRMTRDQHRTCGLDPRAFDGAVWYSDDCLVVHNKHRRVLDYYGGFEYVEADNVATIGDYVFYSGYDCSRVQDVLDRFNDTVTEEN